MPLRKGLDIFLKFDSAAPLPPNSTTTTAGLRAECAYINNEKPIVTFLRELTSSADGGGIIDDPVDIEAEFPSGNRAAPDRGLCIAWTPALSSLSEGEDEEAKK